MQHGSLLVDIAWFSQGVPKGPVQIQETRRLSRDGYFFHESQRDCRHAIGFDFPCEQSHGPRTDRSGGDQQCQIDLRLTDAVRDFPNRRHEPLGTAHQAETIVIPSHWFTSD